MSSLVLVKTMQQIDRLVGASSPSDALDSIRDMIDSVRSSSSSSKEVVESMVRSDELMLTVCRLLSESKLAGGMEVEDGSSTICDLLDGIVSHHPSSCWKAMLQLPKEGQLVHSLLDLLCNPNRTDRMMVASSTRIRAMKVMSVLIGSGSLVQSQILSAPEGLNRIVDLLQDDSMIRNEAILFCTTLAKNSASSARLMIFREGFEKVLNIALQEYNHQGSLVVVSDCLQLCLQLIQQDGMGPEVFLGSRSLIDCLAGFLDLRHNSSYLHPNNHNDNDNDNDDDDDLDDILKEKQTSSNKKKEKKKKEKFVPFVSEEEADVCKWTLELIRELMGEDPKKRRARQQSLLAHPTLVRLLGDMALYTLPPHDAPFVSNVPKVEIQRLALNVLADLPRHAEDAVCQSLLSTPSLYLHNVDVLERVMYLICTGNGVNTNHMEAMTLSTHALAVLRASLTSSEASVMMLHMLVPPPIDPSQPPQSQLTVVHRLVNTLAENLYFLRHDNTNNNNNNQQDQMTVQVVGAAGALGVFLTNGAGETTREMLLKVLLPSPTNDSDDNVTLIQCILTFLESNDNHNHHNDDSAATLSLLRLLIEWVQDCSLAIEAIFSSPSSLTLGLMFKQKQQPMVQALTGLLLGFSMEYMTADQDIGGWSRQSIMNLITSGMGIAKYIQLLESIKQQTQPWNTCPSEQTNIQQWFTQTVRIVRRRTVQQLTIGTNDDDDDDDQTSDDNDDNDDDPVMVKSKDKKMNRFLAQQSLEIETLRQQLETSQKHNQQQALEIKEWKRRMESTPSQLDDILNEYKDKIDELQQQTESLEQSAKDTKSQHNADMQQKETQIETIQQQLQEARDECTQARNNEDIMRSELEALSSAYTSLETEYNHQLQQQQQQQQPTTEQHNLQTQAGGDTTEDPTPTLTNTDEANALTEENTKLKNEMKAANEWMAMAVKQIDALQTELNNNNNNNKSETDENTWQEQISLLENNLKDITLERDMVQSKFQLLQQQFDTLLTSAASNDSNTPSDNDLLDSKLKDANDKIHQKDLELKELNRQLEVVQQQSQTNDEAQTLKVSLKKISVAYKDAQAWMANAVKHHQSLTKQCEQERKKNEQFTSQIHTLQTKAKDDLQIAERQIAQLTKERNDLEYELQLIQKETKLDSKLENAQTQIYEKQLEFSKQLKEEVTKRENTERELNEIRNLLSISENKSQELVNKEIELNRVLALNKSETENMTHQISELGIQITNLNKHIKDTEKKNEDLSALLQSKEADLDNVHKENDELSKELQKNDAESITLKEKNDMLSKSVSFKESELKKMENKLKPLLEEIAMKTTEIGDLKEESAKLLQTSEKQAREAAQEIELLKERLSRNETEIQELMIKNKFMTPEKAQKETELSKLRSTLEELKVAAKNEHSELEDRIKNMQGELERKEKIVIDMETWLKTAQDQQALQISASATYEEENIKLRKQVESLTQSNKAAKDWMGNAVKRHELMAQQMKEFKESNLQLRNEVQKLRSDAESSARAFKEDIQSLNEQLNAKKDYISRLDEQVVELQCSKRESEEKANVELMQLKSELNLSKEAEKSTREELENAKVSLQKYNEVKIASESTLTELENAKEEISKLVSERDERDVTIEDMRSRLTDFQSWSETAQQRFADLENKKKDADAKALLLEDESQILREEINSLCEQLNLNTSTENDTKEAEVQKDSFTIELVKGKMEQLESENISLIEKLKSIEINKAEADTKITELEKTAKKYNELEMILFEKENALADMEADLVASEKEAKDSKKQSDILITQLQERNNELQDTLQKLEFDIASHDEKLRAESTAANTPNDNSNNSTQDGDDLLAQIETLKAQSDAYENSVKEHADAIDQLQLAVTERDSAIAASEEQISALTKELEEAEDQYEGVLNQWQERVQQLEGTIDELEDAKLTLEKSIETQKGEASDVISQWENRCEEMNIQILELEKDKEKNESYSNEVSDLVAKVSELEELVSMKDRLIKSSKDVREESEEMRATICQLEDELGIANESLQSQLTDKVSDRATEVATQMIRAELEEVRLTLSRNQDTLADERESRFLAEQEVQRLKSDLVALAQANEQEEHLDGHIRKLTSKAMDEISNKERHAIHELKISLERAMHDLEISRCNEKDAQEKAASSRLHASICEQELQVAKSDLAFLKQAIEESRESESNVRSSLEYRISALEDDREILLRSHTDELEKTQAELTQLNMEKERLAHCLSESEKANSALVYSTSIESDVIKSSSDSQELEKLRLEKAQLLAASSDASLKTERRIREAIAAHVSSSESEIMLERELREAAESALEDAQTQFKSMQKTLETMKQSMKDKSKKDTDSNLSLSSTRNSSEMKKELTSVNKELLALKKENDDLKAELEKSVDEANVAIARLEEKNRLAEAKAREMEQESSFEAAVAAEVSRLRSESSLRKHVGSKDYISANSFVVFNDKSSDESKYSLNSGAQEIYDFVSELKAAIKEERMLYHELLTEHEELLALFAQQDLELASLHCSLSKIGGDDAVKLALSEAEKKTVDQFGRYIKLR